MNVWLRMPITYCVVGIALAFFFESVRADWAGLVVLGALVILYAFLAKGEKDDGRFRTGDNSYFIGFVYTLSIITLSLMLDADTLLDGAGDGVSPLLKTIGIALGTSVVGMLCRFLLTHDIRVAEDEFDREVRAAAAAAAQLKGTVDAAAKSAAHLGGAVREAAEASAPLSKVVNGLRQTVDVASRDMETLVRATRASVDEATKTVRALTTRTAADNADAVGYLQKAANAHAEALQASLRRIASSLDNYTESVHASARRFGETLDEATRQAIGTMAKGVTESLREVNQMLASAVDNLTRATAAAVAQAGEARSALTESGGATFGRDVESLAKTTVQLRETVAAFNSQLSRLAEGELMPPYQVPAHLGGSAGTRGAVPENRPSSEHDSPLGDAPPKTSEGQGGWWAFWTRRR